MLSRAWTPEKTKQLQTLPLCLCSPCNDKQIYALFAQGLVGHGQPGKPFSKHLEINPAIIPAILASWLNWIDEHFRLFCHPQASRASLARTSSCFSSSDARKDLLPNSFCTLHYPMQCTLSCTQPAQNTLMWELQWNPHRVTHGEQYETVQALGIDRVKYKKTAIISLQFIPCPWRSVVTSLQSGSTLRICMECVLFQGLNSVSHLLALGHQRLRLDRTHLPSPSDLEWGQALINRIQY